MPKSYRVPSILVQTQIFKIIYYIHHINWVILNISAKKGFNKSPKKSLLKIHKSKKIINGHIGNNYLLNMVINYQLIIFF